MDREEIRIAAGKVETLKCGNPVHTVSREIVETCSRKAVAEKFGLSEMEVAKAVTIEKKAAPEVKEAYPDNSSMGKISRPGLPEKLASARPLRPRRPGIRFARKAIVVHGKMQPPKIGVDILSQDS